jgi:hypothetical protein
MTYSALLTVRQNPKRRASERRGEEEREGGRERERAIKRSNDHIIKSYKSKGTTK